MLTKLVRGATAAARVLFVAVSGYSAATHGSPLAADEDLFLADLPVVLTPSRLPQLLNEAPAAVTVIDRELIEATGYRDLPRLLRLVPGMQVGQERGNSHWVTYHGMGNDYPSWMQVLVDGRSVYSPGSFNGVDWAGLPITMDEIERIEVVRGTNSVAYGSNAFLGVINIITRDSADNPGLRVTASGGNAGIQGGSLSWSQTLAGGGGLRLNAEAKQDQGFDKLHDSQRFNVMSLRGDKSLDGRNEITFRVAASEGRRQLGYADSIFGNNAERAADSFNGTFHVQWRHLPAADEEVLIHYYRNQDRTTEEWQATAPPPFGFKVPLDRDRNSVRDNLEIQHRWSATPGVRVVWGGEARHDRVESPFLYFGAPRQQSTLGRLFGQAEWRARPDLLVNASALMEKFDDGKPHFSPRLFANWQAAPDHTLRAGYARAWREPNLFEKYGDVQAEAFGLLLVRPFLPNPALQASRMDSLELGYVARLRPGNTQFDLRLFHERIGNYIYRVSHPEYTVPLLAATLPSARYENLADPVTLSGIEYQLDSRPRPGTRLLFSHSLIRRQAPMEAIAQLTAPYTASLTWMQEWPAAWSTTLSVLRMGPLAGGTGFVPTATYVSRPYTTFDARLARRFALGTTPATLSLMATNLGSRHQEIADRAEQALHGSDPVNPTSPQVWLTLGLNLR